MVDQIAVLFDYENVRRTAEGIFGGSLSTGSPSPVVLADLIARRRNRSTEVASIVIVRSKPNPAREPEEFARFAHDDSSWARDERVRRHNLPLHYGPNRERSKEAGVDVLLALELCDLARSCRYDALVLFTEDLDLKPAVDRSLSAGAHVELASWRRSSRSGRYAGTTLVDTLTSQKSVWNHALDEDDFWASLAVAA